MQRFHEIFAAIAKKAKDLLSTRRIGMLRFLQILQEKGQFWSILTYKNISLVNAFQDSTYFYFDLHWIENMCTP